jgi:hypothetical protein
MKVGLSVEKMVLNSVEHLVANLDEKWVDRKVFALVGLKEKNLVEMLEFS